MQSFLIYHNQGIICPINPEGVYSSFLNDDLPVKVNPSFGNPRERSSGLYSPSCNYSYVFTADTSSQKYPKCKPSSYPNVIQCQCAMIILTSAKMYCTYTKDVWALLQHKGMSIPDNSETTNVTLSLIWDWGNHFQAATNSSHARSEPGAPPALCAGSHLAPAIRVISRASVKVIVAHFSRWGHPLLVWT